MSDAGLQPEEVRAEARRLLDAECSGERRRAAMASAAGWGPLWQRMVAAGWTALSAPERFGGLHAEPAVTAAVLEELGAHCAGGPLAPSLLAAWAVSAGGTEDQQARWLPGMAAGAVTGAVAPGGPFGHPGPAALTVRSAGGGDGAVASGHGGGAPRAGLTGEAGLVLSGRGSDLVIVPVLEPGRGVSCVVVSAGSPDVAVVDQPSWDPTRATASVRLAGYPVAPEDRLGAPGLYEQLLSRGAWMLACDSVGVAARCLQMTTEHGLARRQFGRPIASFEAWKHRCADLFILLQEARMAVRQANAVLAEAEAATPTGAAPESGEPTLGEPAAGSSVAFATSAAKFLAGDNAVEIAGAAIQLHGAIGYTWEHDLHLLLKRAVVNRSLFGDSAYHRERAARSLLGPAR